MKRRRAGKKREPASLALQARQWRAEAPFLLAVFCALLALYGYTALPGIGLEDDAIFVSALHAFGVAQPPGYPLYSLFGGAFYHVLPFGAPAQKAHWFSGFAGALAATAFCAVILQIARGRLFAVAGALAFGASEAFWSQAIIAEVYTLNAFLFFVALAIVAHYARLRQDGKKGDRALALAAAVAGFGLANHLTLFALAATGIAWLLAPHWRHVVSRLPVCLPVFAAAVAPPHIWMVWRSQTDVFANFAGPIEGVGGFFAHLFRHGHVAAAAEHADWENRAAILSSFADNLLWQFSPLGLVFAAAGVAALAKTNRLLLAALLTSAGGVVLPVSLFLGQMATPIALAGYNVFYLPAYGAAGVLLAVGAASAGEFAARRLPRRGAAVFSWALAAALAGAPLGLHWAENNRRDDHWAHDFAAEKLRSLPPNAALFLSGDWDAPVGYLRFVEGMRPDVDIYEAGGMAYGNRLFSPFAPAAQRREILRRFGRESGRPLYVNWRRWRDFLSEGKRGVFTGFYWRIVDEDSPFQADHQKMLEWLRRNMGAWHRVRDEWSAHQRYIVAYRMLRNANLSRLGGAALPPGWGKMLEAAGRRQNAYYRVIGGLESVIKGGMSEDDMRRELAWAREFAPASDPYFPLDDHVFAPYYRARLLAALGGEDGEDYLQALEEAMRQRRAGVTPAPAAALAVYARRARWCDYWRTATEFSLSAQLTVLPPSFSAANCPAAN